MRYNLIQDSLEPEHWHAEVFEAAEPKKRLYVVTFSGDDAKARAERYIEQQRNILEPPASGEP